MPQTPSQTDTYNTALDIFDKTHPLRVDVDENLKVTGTFVTTPSGTQDVNIVGNTVTIPVSQSGTWTVNLATEPTIDIGKVDQGTGGASPWLINVNNFPSVQPISGTVTTLQGTSPWVVSGTVTANAGTGTFLVDGSAHTQPVSGTFFQATQPVSIAGTVNVDVTNTVPVTLASTTITGNVTVVQPTGSNLHVAVDNFPATQPVSGTVTANQGTSPWVTSLASTTITGTVAVTQSTSPWTVDGTVTANAGTGNFTVVQPTGTNLHVVVDSVPSTVVTQGTSPWVVSGTVTANLGTIDGAATAANQTTEIANQTNGTQVTQVSNFPASQTVNGTVTVVQPTGANLNVAVSNFPADADAYAQGSTTAGQLGALIMGAVTTKPTISTSGTTTPVSLTVVNGVRTTPTDPYTGQQQWVTSFNTARASPFVKLVGSVFVGNTVDPNFWTIASAGSGSVTQSAGELVLGTGVTLNSTAAFGSVLVARHIPGAELEFRAELKVSDTGTANNTRNWGAFTASDGLFFQLDSDGLAVVTRAGGVDTVTEEASWNTDNTFVLDLNYHKYEIIYSSTTAGFYIDDVLRHYITVNKTPFSILKYQSTNLPISLQNINSGGGTSNVTITFTVAFIGRTGLLESEARSFHLTTASTTVLKYGAGRLHRITINQYAAAASLITVYDNTAGSGTVVGVISGLGGVQAAVTLEYGCPVSTGLTLVSTGTWDATVIYE
jgi:hypothetical protein